MAKIEIDKEIVFKKLQNGIGVCTLAREFGVHRGTILSRIKKWDFKPQQLKFNHNFFENIDTENKAYWLGFLMADGCVSMTHRPKVMINLAEKDYDHLVKFHQDLHSCLKVKNWGRGFVMSQHYSLKMCNDLISHGCVPRKSLVLEFPKIEDGLLHHFIRGYFDGDGCITIGNKNQKTPQKKISFVGTVSFLEKLKDVLLISSKLRKRKNDNVMTLEANGNKQSGRIIDWMYRDATIFLNRKRKACYGSL